MTEIKSDGQDWLLIRTIQDERLQTIRLADFDLIPPAVNIFDEPTRCYRVNVQWAKIITGAIDLLLEIACWRDAEHEDYPAIQAIKDFLIGENCMDCNGVETCLQSSPTIQGMIANIAANLTAIQSNDADIAALDGRVTQNETNIANNDNQITNLQTQVNQHTLDIDDLQLSIQQHQLTLNNHETRITALENAGGGGGNGTPVEALVWETFLDAKTTAIGNTLIVDNIPDYFEELEIKIFGRSSTVTNKIVYMFANDDLVQSNYQTTRIAGTLQNNAEITLADPSNLPVGQIAPTVIRLFELKEGNYGSSLSRYGRNGYSSGNTWLWENTAQISKLSIQLQSGDWIIGTHILVYGLRRRNVLIGGDQYNSPVVANFEQDTTDYPYYYVADTWSLGSFSASGGNPNGCYIIQNLGGHSGNLVGAEIDLLSAKPVTRITFDYWLSNVADFAVNLYIDGSWNALNPLTLGISGQWNTYDSDMWSTNLPATGQLISFLVNHPFGTSAEIRLDNFKVYFS